MFTTKQIRGFFLSVFFLFLLFPLNARADIGLGFLTDFINSFWEALYNTLTWFADGIIFCFQSSVYWVLDSFFTIILAFLGILDFSAFVQNITLSWVGLPSQLLYLVNTSYIPQGLTILGSAYLVRLLLNLIPGTITRL